MAYQIRNYDLTSMLPEWIKRDVFAGVISQYTEETVTQALEDFLKKFGVVQPWQLWKRLPKEYNWVHRFTNNDKLVSRVDNNNAKGPELVLGENRIFKFSLPVTKRPVHAKIKIKLQNELSKIENPIKWLEIKNADQVLRINKITDQTFIEINTEDNIIKINGVGKTVKIDGNLKWLRTTPKTKNYNILSVEDENAKLDFEISSSGERCPFIVDVELIDPIYVIEQNVRLFTLTSFPLESVKLYGYFCNEYNPNNTWKCLYEKTYNANEKVVSDYFVTQFDVEKFFVEVKYRGLSGKIYKGFPQSVTSSDKAFEANVMLDNWGKIFGIPRRIFKSNISPEEEPYTYPPYYDYQIEQDYWYEKRLINEYKYNEDAKDSLIIKDTYGTDIAVVNTIDPYIENLYLYTESKIPDLNDLQHREMLPFEVEQIDEHKSVFNNPQNIKFDSKAFSYVEMQPINSKTVNTELYKSNPLRITFKTPSLPEDILITGIEFILEGETNTYIDNIQITEDSVIELPFKYKDLDGNTVWKTETFNLYKENSDWPQGEKIHIIGGENELFGLDKIEPYQIQDNINILLDFINTSSGLEGILQIFNIKCRIHFKQKNDDVKITHKLTTRRIDNDEITDAKLSIKIKNIGEVPIVDESLFVVVPNELLADDEEYLEFVYSLPIDNEIELECQIRPKPPITSGIYDIAIITKGKTSNDTITVLNVREA